MRISDGSSDVCSSDLPVVGGDIALADVEAAVVHHENLGDQALAGILLLAQEAGEGVADHRVDHRLAAGVGLGAPVLVHVVDVGLAEAGVRSEEHTSALQSLMRMSYAVFCLKKKKQNKSESQT